MMKKVSKNVNKWMYEWHDVTSLFENLFVHNNNNSNKKIQFLYSLCLRCSIWWLSFKQVSKFMGKYDIFFLTPFSSLPFGDFCLVLLTNINANNTYKEKLHKIKFFSLLLSRSVRVNGGMRWNRFSCYKNFQIYKSRPNYSINLLV